MICEVSELDLLPATGVYVVTIEQVMECRSQLM